MVTPEYKALRIVMMEMNKMVMAVVGDVEEKADIYV